MFSGKSESFLELKLPEPYLSTYRANYVEEGDRFFIIVTGKWCGKLRNCGYALVRGEVYTAKEEMTGAVINRFREKYGTEHLNFHHMDTGTGFILERSDNVQRSRYDILGMEFDQASKDYDTSISSNPVEIYMRSRTSEVLSLLARDGMSILEIGCGTLIESSAIKSNISLTCAEISNQMLNIAAERSKTIENIKLELVKVSSGVIRTDKKYDIIFTTYGYLDLEDLKTIETTLNENLKVGGMFIGAYWNRFGIFDIFLSLMLGRFEYVREKLKGLVLPECSRFSTATRPKKPLDFSRLSGFSIVQRRGVCTVIPPYNFLRIVKHFANKRIPFALDRATSSLPIIKNFADYIMVVLRREHD
ncbi:MAG: class I SAM-dependent methyltransferase [Candidatus Thermoplasmatota archaeon]|nr:class I SAM-dependent methyltransferase [Candidatus Thermoplasmatota archaeon]